MFNWAVIGAEYGCMPDHRKPTQPGNRAEGSLPSADLEFSIETTTMRLKSLKLRRAEAADKALDDHLRQQTGGNRNEPTRDTGPAGRVRHDERGMAVWDWAAAAGETAALSATNVMRKLDVSGLSIEQTQRSLKAVQPPSGAGTAGGGDPYNQHRNQVNEDPLKRAVPGGDPYNRVNAPKATSMHRPAPKSGAPAPAPVKKPGSSVLDQLLGRKK